ncbi:MAG: hypothetical protein LIO90_05880, partial [Bacteroidales bacterium]|nr:hypothetical protein [Bacteroidales bacterium]
QGYNISRIGGLYIFPMQIRESGGEILWLGKKVVSLCANCERSIPAGKWPIPCLRQRNQNYHKY